MRHERRRVLRRTKIVCTLGPATGTIEMLERLVRTGMDCARINFSHGSLDEHRKTFERIRSVRASSGRPVAILADLQGPKLRVGPLPAPIELVKGEEIVLAGLGSAQPGDLELGFEVDFSKHVRRGRPVLINDGHVRLRVRDANGQRCRCVVEVAGAVSSYKGVNLPGTYLPIPSITEGDRDNLTFAVEQDADYVALSFVRRAEDVEDLRAMIAALGGRQRVIAKIEKAEAVEQLDAIVAAADGLMVARGDLGVEIGAAAGEDLELGFELDFARVVRPGSPVMIDDGRVRLRVVEALGKRVRCRVETGGLIRSQKGVNLPGSYLPIPSITDRDREMLEHAVRWDVDYVALSFVRRAEDVEDLKRLIQGLGGRQRVIAKIEKLEAIEQLESIVAVTDALMVARGDLGVEIGAAEVPMLQKRMIRMGREAGKTVITATQMLESMIEAPEPTRAEASDVANAILDGTSAIMLSGETAVGKYPVEAVDTMVRIAAAVEPEFAYRDTPFEATRQGPRYISDVVGHAACDMAEIIEAAAIIVPTVSGETAREVSRHRPHRPIVACTPSRDVQRQLMLDWAVLPLALDPTKDVETLWLRSIDAVQRAGIAGPGDRVVITSGTNVNRPGATNTILVQTL